MTSTTNASAMLADALAQLSKDAYSTFTENQSRLDVLRAVSETREAQEETHEARRETREARKETREARSERDEIARELQRWKEAASDSKAALGQAEITIAHQAETIESQNRTIAELQREVSHSRKLQEHFLRIEGERYAQSHIDEPLQYARPPQPDQQTPVASRSTLIRHVKAVVNIKREESDDDSAEDFSARRSRKIIGNDDEHDLTADRNPVLELRHRNNVVNYREEDDDDDDELMMGFEENHDEVYGTQRVEALDTQRSKQQPHSTNPTPVIASLPKKKRKVAAR